MSFFCGRLIQPFPTIDSPGAALCRCVCMLLLVIYPLVFSSLIVVRELMLWFYTGGVTLLLGVLQFTVLHCEVFRLSSLYVLYNT